LNRAYKAYLEPLPFGEISMAYAAEFSNQGKTIDSKTLEEAAEATRGYPYLFKLIGYYILGYSKNTDLISEDIVSQAVNTSKRDMIEGIFNAALKPLSPHDKDFLTKMAKDLNESKISDVRDRLNVSKSYAQIYRMRLIEAGIIAPTGRGALTFVIPYLGEYLRGEF